MGYVGSYDVTGPPLRIKRTWSLRSLQIPKPALWSMPSPTVHEISPLESPLPGGNKVGSMLNCRCKTHKRQGVISCRSLAQTGLDSGSFNTRYSNG